MLVPIAILAVISVMYILAGLFVPDLIAKVRRRPHGTVDAKPVAAPLGKPDSLEGVLVAQLVRGEITPTQYRRSVEGLAARDDDRNPLAVPPDLGPADA